MTNPDKSREFERTLTIKGIIDTAIPISSMRRSGIGMSEISRAIDIQLTKLVASLNLKWTLSDHQIKSIVEDLLDKYPNETIEDFVLVFKKARMAEFKDEDGKTTIYRLDSAVIFGWMDQYLDEKYQVIEDELMKEKETFKNQVFESGSDWLQLWKESLAINPEETVQTRSQNLNYLSHLRALSPEEIKWEGQERPKRPQYISTMTKEEYELKENISRCAAQHYKQKNIFDFTGFQHFPVDQFTVFAKTSTDAQEIYIEAISKMNSQEETK